MVVIRVVSILLAITIVFATPRLKVSCRRRHSRLDPRRQAPMQHSARAPLHVFTLPRACRKRPCQHRAIKELNSLECTDVLLFENLFIIKAKCPEQSLKALAGSQRFVDLSPDHSLRLAAPAPSLIDRTPEEASTRTQTTSRESEKNSWEPQETPDSFERTATIRFSPHTLRNGAQVVVGHAVNGKRERFWLSRPRRAAQCSRTRGRGVTVYVIDTGCRITHTELAGRAVAVAAPGSRFSSGADDHGHGTHVAATIAGRRFGLASDARVVCIKALSERNEGSSGDVIAGIQLAVRMHERGRRGGHEHGAVISISLGVRAPRRYKALDRALGEAQRHGLVAVVAAGNAGGDACSFTPARASAAVTVAATGKDGGLAHFSNRGPCVTVAAPGVHVWSAIREGDDRYGRSSGTSMAAPFVSGLAALVLANEHGLRTEQVMRRLKWIGGARGGRRRQSLPVVSVDGYCQYEWRRAREKSGRLLSNSGLLW